MNTRSVLIVSLALNVVAGAGIIYLLPRRQPAEAPASSPAPAQPRPAARDVSRPAEKPAPSAAPARHFDWRLVESQDYKKYIANLRAIGCPEETIRDIIIADVNKLFESRQKSLPGSTNRFQYWKAGNPFVGLMDEERIKRNQELSREKRALLKELLGIEPEEPADMFAGFNPFETMLDFLPASKRTQLMELEQKFAARMMKSMDGGVPDAEDMKEIRKIQQEKDAEMAKILGPQEKEEYDLRLSQTAMMMRFQLGGFEPSEQEFRDIFKLRKEFDDQFGNYFGPGLDDKASAEKREAAQKELNTQIKGLLGDARYAEYERNQDFAYQGLAKVVERQGLPKETAVKVYDMKKIAEDQVKKLQADRSLPDDKRAEALRAIQAETQRAISQTLGEKGFEAYKGQPGGRWIERLAPTPPVAPVPEVRPPE